MEGVLRLGKSGNSRSVLIKFVRVKWVKLLFSKVKEVNERNLRTSNDLSKEKRLKWRSWMVLFGELRSLGFEISLILVDDKSISVEDINKLL